MPFRVSLTFFFRTVTCIKFFIYVTDFVKCSSNINKFVGKCFTAGNIRESNTTVEMDINIPELVTSQWYKKNKRQMWTQHFIYFCREKELYNLYRHTPPTSTTKTKDENDDTTTNNKASLESKSFVAHWKEKGAHFDGKSLKKKDIQPLLQLTDVVNINNNNRSSSPSIMEFPPSSTLKRYDFGANLVTMVGHLDLAASSPGPFSTSQRNPQQQQQEEKQEVLPPVVMSAAIGYSLKHFEKFIGSLREHYFGDVWLLISKDYSSSDDDDSSNNHSRGDMQKNNDELESEEETESTLIRRYLQMHNVNYLETDMGKSGGVTTGSGWEKINRDRFIFFDTVCKPLSYSLCLTTDFRDSVFQSNPFANFDRLLLPPPQQLSSSSTASTSSSSPSTTMPSGILHVFEHNKDMSKWHYVKMKEPRCDLYEQYGKVLKGTNIINGGSIIGSPYAFQRIVEYMGDKWKGCNDQVVLNILVRANILTTASSSAAATAAAATITNATETKITGTDDNHEPIVVEIHQQGYGPMNVLGHGGMVLKDNKGRYMNRNCIVVPVVHQYDLVRCPRK